MVLNSQDKVCDHPNYNPNVNMQWLCLKDEYIKFKQWCFIAFDQMYDRTEEENQILTDQLRTFKASAEEESDVSTENHQQQQKSLMWVILNLSFNLISPQKCLFVQWKAFRNEK